MYAIKLSKPLMDAPPEKYRCTRFSGVFAALNLKKGGVAVRTIYPEKSFFKLIFFQADTPPFARHTSRL
jgi:hypothetical protein